MSLNQSNKKQPPHENPKSMFAQSMKQAREDRKQELAHWQLQNEKVPALEEKKADLEKKKVDAHLTEQKVKAQMTFCCHHKELQSAGETDSFIEEHFPDLTQLICCPNASRKKSNPDQEESDSGSVQCWVDDAVIVCVSGELLPTASPIVMWNNGIQFLRNSVFIIHVRAIIFHISVFSGTSSVNRSCEMQPTSMQQMMLLGQAGLWVSLVCVCLNQQNLPFKMRMPHSGTMCGRGLARAALSTVSL